MALHMVLDDFPCILETVSREYGMAIMYMTTDPSHS